MKKFFITLSGIYLFILGLLFLLCSVLGVANAGEVKAPPLTLIWAFVISAGLLALSIGIFKRKNWARLSLFVLSAFVLSSGVGMLFFLPPYLALKNPDISGIVINFTSIFFVGIPLFFLAFFNFKSVRETFKTEGQSRRPTGVTLIAIMYFLSLLSTLPLFFKDSYIDQFPLVFGSILVYGITAKIFMLISTAVSVYIAVGLWKLKRSAWITAMAYNGFCLLWGTINLLLINEEMLSKIYAQHPEYNLSLSMYKFCSAFALLLPIVILAYLYKKQNFFETS